MPPPRAAIRAEGISLFLQNAQMKAFADKISSFEETVKSLQADNARLEDHHAQEIDSLKALVKSLQASTNKSEVDNAALQGHHTQEIGCLQTIVKSLRDSIKKNEADNAKLQHQYDKGDDSMQGVVRALQDFAKKAEADKIQLQDAITELRAQPGHIEGLSADGGAPRDHESLQSGTQPQEPSARQPLSNRFGRTINMQRLSGRPQHDTQADHPLSPSRDHRDNRGSGPSRPLEQQFPRGIKRARVDDAAEPHRQDRSQARRDVFFEYYHSKRKEYKNANLGKDKGAFIRGFIDGIVDPDYCRWFQGALKKQFPERVQDKARTAGKRFVSVPRDMTWEDVKTVLSITGIPFFPG